MKVKSAPKSRGGASLTPRGQPGRTPSGEGSTSLGTGRTPSGEGSTSLGTGRTQSGEGSTSLGTGRTPSGEGSTSLGTGRTPSGEGSTSASSGGTPLAAPVAQVNRASRSASGRPQLNLNDLARRQRGRSGVGQATQEMVERIHSAQQAGIDFFQIASAEIRANPRAGTLIKAFEFILALQPENQTTLARLHHIYVVAGRDQEASSVAEKLQKRGVASHELSFGAAWLAQSSNKPELARKVGEEALGSVSRARAVAEAVAVSAEKAALGTPSLAPLAEERRSLAQRLSASEREVRIFLGRHLANVGLSDRAYETYLGLGPDPSLDIDDAASFARVALQKGDFKRAAAIAEGSHASAQDSPVLEIYVKSIAFAAHASAGNRGRARELWPETSALWEKAFARREDALSGTSLAVAGHLLAGVIALRDPALLLEAARLPYAREDRAAHAPDLAEALTKVGETDTALALLEAAVATRPEAIISDGPRDVHAGLVLALGDLQSRLGRGEAALETLKRGFDEGRLGSPEVRELGLAFLRVTLDRAGQGGLEPQDATRARAVLDRLAQTGPSPELFEMQARLLFAEGRYGEAIDRARRATELAPESSNLAMLHGICCVWESTRRNTSARSSSSNEPSPSPQARASRRTSSAVRSSRSADTRRLVLRTARRSTPSP